MSHSQEGGWLEQRKLGVGEVKEGRGKKTMWGLERALLGPVRTLAGE